MFCAVQRGSLFSNLLCSRWSREHHIWPNYFLKNRKQCVKISNTYRNLILDIISGVSQGSIVSQILFNIFFNDFFYVILIASAQSYADSNTLTSFGKTLKDFIQILGIEYELALTWFRNNKMMVNPNKF